MAGVALLGGCVLRSEQQGHVALQKKRIMAHDLSARMPRANSSGKDGSLWNDNGPLNELFVNPKAGRIGDIVTVMIVESSKATNEASTDTQRASEFSAQIEKFLGLQEGFPKGGTSFNPFGEIKAGLDSTFKGKGATKRSGKLDAKVTARVVEVMPGGNLRIRGFRQVMINNEAQLITLTGIIRPRDISVENVVLSSRIADARITYNGIGVVNDRQRPGWLARLFDVIFPF
jgi:flagellar L-ring protein precursor FlgH